MRQKLSVVLAVFNEQSNLTDCLESIKDIAEEIVIVDGGSTDKTVEIAKSFDAKIIETNNPPIFHINKQKALDAAKNEWILQLDADERVTEDLSREIVVLMSMTADEIADYQEKIIAENRLFSRHFKILQERDGKVGTDEGEYVAFLIPRLNFFLGKYLRYGGTYPDPAIRLVKKNKASFPCESVHEQMSVDGRVGWLKNPMLHKDSPTFRRYLERNNRYINLMVKEFQEAGTDKNLWQFYNFVIHKPISWFLMTQIRHKGILDGYQGIIFSLFSALRFPRSYIRYLFND